jgi:hypothetical protein
LPDFTRACVFVQPGKADVFRLAIAAPLFYSRAARGTENAQKR